MLKLLIIEDNDGLREQMKWALSDEYEVLEAVFDENEAIKPGAPVIHDETDSEDIHEAKRNIVHHIEAEEEARTDQPQHGGQRGLHQSAGHP